MEYERASRNDRGLAGAPAVQQVKTIGGPVGVRNRTVQVANYVEDQLTVIGLLAEIPPSRGGKQGIWDVPPLAGGHGQCPRVLADAIWDFQEHWRKAGVFRFPDGVVDPAGNTLKQLNLLAPSGGGGGRAIPIDPKPKPPGPRTGFPWDLLAKLKPRFTNWKIDGTASISMSFGPIGGAAGRMKLANKLNPGSSVPLGLAGFGLSFGPSQIPGGLEIAPASFPSWGSPVHAGPRARSQELPLDDLLGNCLLLGMSLGAGATADYSMGGNATVVMFNVGSNRPLSSLPHDVTQLMFGSTNGFIMDSFNTCMGWATTVGQFAGFSVGVSLVGGRLVRESPNIRPDPIVR